MSFYTPSHQVLNPSFVYTDHIYTSQFAHPQAHVPARFTAGQKITSPVPSVSYQVPVSLRQEYQVAGTPPRQVQNISYSQITPQVVTTSCKPIYQGNYELEGRRIIRDSSPLSTKDSQIIYKQHPSEVVYRGRPQTYSPISKIEQEKISELDYIYQSDKQKELDYLNWKESRRSRSPNQIVPSHPIIPLASSYVLQPLQYSDTKQAISNYENNLMTKLNTTQKFKQMKEDMNKCSYTYSQMIKILLALKEIEKCKNDLVNRDDFNIQLFYNSLNNNDRNKTLTSHQLKMTLSSLNFPNIEIQDIELLFAKYSNERSADYISQIIFHDIYLKFSLFLLFVLIKQLSYSNLQEETMNFILQIGQSILKSYLFHTPLIIEENMNLKQKKIKQQKIIYNDQIYISNIIKKIGNINRNIKNWSKGYQNALEFRKQLRILQIINVKKINRFSILF